MEIVKSNINKDSLVLWMDIACLYFHIIGYEYKAATVVPAQLDTRIGQN